MRILERALILIVVLRGPLVGSVHRLVQLLFRKLLVEHVVRTFWLNQYHVLILHFIARGLDSLEVWLLPTLGADDLKVVACSHIIKLFPYYLLETGVLNIGFGAFLESGIRATTTAHR